MAKQDLAGSAALYVPVLPTPSSALAGVIVRLASDNKPYWCDGTTWIDLTLAGSGSPQGNSKEVQFNNGGSFGGAANVEIDSGDLVLGYNDSPVTPPTDFIKFFGKRYGPTGSRVMPAAVGPSGMDYTLQPSIWRQKIARWNHHGNAVTIPGIDGIASPTAVGTATARAVATTNNLARSKRLGYVSSTTAGSLSGQYLSIAQYTVGNGSNVGGFFYSCRFGVSDASIQSVARMFVGVSSSVAAPTNVDPATLTNAIGIGHKESDTNLFIYYGGSAGQTRIDLGANFPINTTDLYDITLWSPPNQNGVVYYYIERIGTSYKTSGVLGPGTLGTTLPANTTLLAHRAWRSNNTAAAAVGIDISSVYFETDW